MSVFVGPGGPTGWNVSGSFCNVAIDGALGDGQGGSLRHGDLIHIYATNQELALVLRAEMDGETTALPPRTRDWLAVWESSVLGRSHDGARELVVDRSGMVTLFEHANGAHPLDARVLAQGQLSAPQLAALGRVVVAARVGDLGPFERAATDSAVLLLFDSARPRVIRLSRNSIAGVGDGPTFLENAPDLVLGALLGIARALSVGLAAWSAPAIPVARREARPAQEELLLVSTEWNRDDTGARIIVYASGFASSGTTSIDRSTGYEHYQETKRGRLSDAEERRARTIAATDALTEGTHGTSGDSWQLVERYVNGRPVRSRLSLESGVEYPERLDHVARELDRLHRALK